MLSTRSKRHRGKGRLNYANLYTRATESEEIYDLTHGPGSLSSEVHFGNGNNLEEMSATHTFDDIRPEDAADAVSCYIFACSHTPKKL